LAGASIFYRGFETCYCAGFASTGSQMLM